jgi:hypothetical protein
MPKFPKAEPDIVALAQTMVAGYTAHAADFPSVVLADLQTALTDYQTNKDSQADAQAQAKIATETKTVKLVDLVDMMKNDLKLSEVDVGDDPEKLALIGWGPKAPPQPTVAPGQPQNLRPIAEGQGTVWLKWEKPATGGQVRNYILQRRDQNGSAEFGAWTLIESTYNVEINLGGQPRGVQMEYRVIAANAAGESLPSNVAPVVL